MPEIAPISLADQIVADAIACLAEAEGLCPAEAGRTLLAALARWFGIDFHREVDRPQERKGGRHG